ncbi:MAG: FAD:protein FMN transferase, partial [Planctomycetaceae bacterium]|nr:FAD:protein FMN transferase [Planctomycetaceae bacterium]
MRNEIPTSAVCRQPTFSFWDTIMATQFAVIIEYPDDEGERVRAVAEEVFSEIRRLESLLSRFIEDSEISQINRLHGGEEIIVSPETHRCLELALEAKRLSRGHFDAAYLSQGVTCGREAFALFARPCRVVSQAESLRLDLGGIGKG